MSTYLQAVYATMDRAPTKKGKKRRAMKMVCIWAALPDRRGGWQFWVRLTWEGAQTHITQTLFFIHQSHIMLLKFSKPQVHYILNITSISLHIRKHDDLIRALNSIASKVIQHVHKTFSNTRSSLGQITNHTEVIYFWDWSCLTMQPIVLFHKSQTLPDFSIAQN